MPPPLDWKAFTYEHTEFPKLYHKLFIAIPNLLVETNSAANDPAGSIICELMLASMADFDDILLLCSKDRYWGAFKLLRVLFERTVTLKYLAQNPTEAEAFLAFDAVDWEAIMTGIEKRHGIQPNKEAKERIKEKAQTARKRFKQEPCKECGLRKQTAWTPRSSQELAQKTGLDHLHFEGFVLPTKYIHPTYFGSHEMASNPSPPLISTILKITHVLTLETALVHQRYFKGDPLASAVVAEAIQDFLAIWKFSETDFGLGEHAERAGLNKKL